METTASSSWAEAADARADAFELDGEEEFAALYRAHFGFVWSTLRRLGVASESLDDAAQETFLVAYRRLPDFEGRSTIRTWLFAIARRVASGHRRRVARRARGLRLLPRSSAVIDDLDEQLDRAQVRDLLLAFLEELDVDKREAFLLGELEGLSRSEMGAVLEISPNTAYSRLRAAREAFLAAFHSPEDRRALIERARERERSGTAERQRVWTAMLPALSGDLGGSAVGKGGMLAQVKVFALTVGVGVASMSLAKAVSPGQVETPPDAVVVGDALVPAASGRPGSVRASAVALVPAPEDPEAPEPDSPPPVQRPKKTSTGTRASDELRLLQAARTSIEAGQADAALANLERHAQQFAASPLAPERDVLHIEALCASGAVEQARRRAAVFGERHPGAPLLARLEASCVAP